MNDHFLLEAVRVLFTYGVRFTVPGLIVSAGMVVWGSRRTERRLRVSALVAATLVLWLAVVAGVEYGYSAWQSIPNPPAEAFSDTGGPAVVLLLGWLPALATLGAGYHLLRKKDTGTNDS